MARAQAHISGEPGEAEPPASTANGLSARALRRWLSAKVPAASAASETDEADAVQPARAADTESGAADKLAFPALPAPDKDMLGSAERDDDLGLLCGRLDALTRQLSRLATRIDGEGLAEFAATAEDDPVENAITEIFARQRVLVQTEPTGPTMFPPPVSAGADDASAAASPTAPADSAPDLSGLEQQLKLITKQLEIMRSPCRADELIAGLRQELAGIAETLDILVPRSAFDALEQEVHALGDRLDSTRDVSADTASFARLEQGLAEIRGAINDLAPVGLGETVQTLSHKVDQISVAGVDPLTLQQLDAATSSLRSIVTQVASGDALAALVNEVHALSEKIDRNLPNGFEPVPSGLDHDLLVALEREVSGIAATLNAKADQVPAPAVEPLIESIVHKLERFDLFADDETRFAPIKAHISELGDKIDRLQVPQSDAAAFAPLETRLGQLAEKIENLQPPSADPAAYAPLEAKLGHLTDTIERMNTQGIDQSVLAALDERMQAIAQKLDRLEENAPARADIGPLEHRIAELAEKLDASEARLGNLEAIEHGMAELITRLDEIRKAARIDGKPAASTPAPVTAFKPAVRHEVAEPPSFASEHLSLEVDPLALAPDLPRRSSGDGGGERRRAGDAPRAPMQHVSELPMAESWLGSSPQIDPVSPAEPADSLAAAAPMEQAEPAPLGPAEAASEMPSLPADAPIEPGSAPPRLRSRRSTAERIAASQAMLGPMPTERTSAAKARPNFIIAARRAAQAASEQNGQLTAAAAAAVGDIASGGVRQAVTKRVRSLFVSGSVVLLALGATGIMLSISDRQSATGDQAPKLAAGPATTTVVRERSLAAAAVAPTTAPAVPSLLSTPILPPTLQNMNPSADEAAPTSPTVATEAEHHTERLPTVASVDTTGSIGAPRATPALSVPAVPAVPPAQPVTVSKGNSWSEALPPALKTKPLVAGLEAQNPGAAYEIGLRYAEGRGVEVDMAAAAIWFARAAEGGVVPAEFRLGGLYEKGVGVKKDLAQARHYYLAAAERGYALAMHNLAVLYAEGGDGKADFAAALKWFRKGAEHGVADSQYNAAVLLARGIGVEKNLGEAYKWFAIAAKGGDKDAEKKRDEIGQGLDAQTLASARLAASVFVPTPQPAAATAVPAPATGWNDVAVTPKSRPRARHSNSRSAHL